MPVMIPANCKGGTTNPISDAKGVKGNTIVMTNAMILNAINNLLGILFNKDLCVRTINLN